MDADLLYRISYRGQGRKRVVLVAHDAVTGATVWEREPTATELALGLENTALREQTWQWRTITSMVQAGLSAGADLRSGWPLLARLLTSYPAPSAVPPATNSRPARRQGPKSVKER